MATIHAFSTRSGSEEEAYLNTQVHRGRSKTALVNAALRLLMEQEQRGQDWQARIEAKLDVVIEILSREERQ